MDAEENCRREPISAPLPQEPAESPEKIESPSKEKDTAKDIPPQTLKKLLRSFQSESRSRPSRGGSGRSYSLLRTFLVQPDNYAIVRASFNHVQQSLEKLAESCSSASLQAAELLGIAATVLEGHQEVQNFLHHLQSNLESPGTTPNNQLFTLTVFREWHTRTPQSRMNRAMGSWLPRMQQYLETITDHNILISTINILQLLSTSHPDAYAPFFQNTIDIILGWSLDCNTPENLRSSITDQLQKFKKCWIQHRDLGHDLLRKFCHHMQYFASNPHLLGATPPEHQPASDQEPRNNWRVYAGLNMCFSGIFSGLYTATDSWSVDDNTECADLISKLLESLTIVSPRIEDASWARSAVDCILTIARVLKERFGPHFPSALSFIWTLLSPHCRGENRVLPERGADDFRNVPDSLMLLIFQAYRQVHAVLPF